MSVGAPPRVAYPEFSAEAEAAAEQGEESDGEEEQVFVLESRPFGLELVPATEDGRGAVIQSAEGVAAAAGVEPGAALVTINEQPVEELPLAEVEECLEREALPVSIGVSSPLNLPSLAPRKPRRRDPVTVCTACCRGSYRVVSEALAKLGWQETPKEDRDASVVWLEHADSTDGLAPVQTMSRIEAFLHFCRKARLAQSLNQWVEELPDEFAFSPKTWVLPHDAADLEATMSGTKDVFIAKPSSGSQGKGIQLVKKWKELGGVMEKLRNFEHFGKIQGKEYVVQRYVAEPLLLDGLKFDLRLYAVVTSLVPLRAYLFKEGLARFCTVPYQPPKEGNLQEGCMHLTNFAVNKKSKDFQTTEGLEQHAEGSKRSASAVFKQIEEAHGVGAEEMWQKVATLVANTLTAMRPGLVEFYVHEKPKPLHPLGPKGFQIIGLDVLINGDLEPVLLELNANASLSVTQPAGKATSEANDDEPQDEAVPDASSLAPPRGASPKRTASPSPAASGGTRAPSSSATASSGNRQRGCSLRHASRLRLGLADPGCGGGAEKPIDGAKAIISELDLEVKRELVAQAMLLAHPAPQRKVARLKKQWLQRRSSGSGAPPITDHVPLDDSGFWALPSPPSRAEAVRPDTPDICPAMEAIDFEALAVTSVAEYAAAHLSLYRCWRRLIGMQETLGPAPALKLLERMGLVGADGIFQDRVSAQLWLSKAWREAGVATFGLNLPQFVGLVGRLGRMLLGGGAEGAEEEGGPSHVQGVVEFVSRPSFNALAE